MRSVVLFAGTLLLAGCGTQSTSLEDFNTREITLPHGQVIKVETMVDVKDLLRGMMFRQSVPPDHGMLFVRRVAGRYSYFMYQTLVPLDTIWMDANHKIVEIVENMPPCPTAASQCPHYGGKEMSMYTLQVAGGGVKRYGLKVGDTIDF